VKSQSEIGLLVFAWTTKLPRKAKLARRKPKTFS
jgi:hypothetical protein